VARKSDMVFVVDDDFRVREALTDLFASRNLDCVAFASAAEYLRLANPTGPSCLVLDVSMPDIGGLELQSAMAWSTSQSPRVRDDVRRPVAGARALLRKAPILLRQRKQDFLLLPVGLLGCLFFKRHCAAHKHLSLLRLRTHG
jgi:DNA-binding NtrC family response regulator